MKYRLISMLVSFLLLFPAFSCALVNAEQSEQPQVYSISASPGQGLVNQVITYTVITDTSVRIAAVFNVDGTIHELANIDDGFADYTDNGGKRTWALSKRNQLIINEPKTARILNSKGEWTNNDIYSEHVIIKLNSDDEPAKPWAKNDNEPETGGIAGSFIQPWLFLYWDQERWDKEFELMKELDMQYIIIQNTSDRVFSNSPDGSIYGPDYSRYNLISSYCIYPSQLPEFQNYYNGLDQMEMCLNAAEKYDMQVILGSCIDTRWWLYGWGNPELMPGQTDAVTGSYFARFCQEEAELSARIFEEIWDMYGERYGDQIFGWYYTDEIWNMDAACNGTDGGAYAEIIGSTLNTYLDTVERITPEKPLSLSPFMNFTLSTPEGYGQFWQDIFEVANFRPHDIFMPQDCVGNNEDRIENELESWVRELSTAAKEEGMHSWINNETFSGPDDLKPAPINRLIRQYEITGPYAEQHVLFSWNHYYNPAYKSEYEPLHDELKSFIKSKSEKSEYYWEFRSVGTMNVVRDSISWRPANELGGDYSDQIRQIADYADELGANYLEHAIGLGSEIKTTANAAGEPTLEELVPYYEILPEIAREKDFNVYFRPYPSKSQEELIVSPNITQGQFEINCRDYFSKLEKLWFELCPGIIKNGDILSTWAEADNCFTTVLGWEDGTQKYKDFVKLAGQFISSLETKYGLDVYHTESICGGEGRLRDEFDKETAKYVDFIAWDHYAGVMNGDETIENMKKEAEETAYLIQKYAGEYETKVALGEWSSHWDVPKSKQTQAEYLKILLDELDTLNSNLFAGMEYFHFALPDFLIDYENAANYYASPLADKSGKFPAFEVLKASYQHHSM